MVFDFCLGRGGKYPFEFLKGWTGTLVVDAYGGYDAIQRIAWLYKIEADARDLSSIERLRMRQQKSKPLWEALHLWVQLERTRVPEGSAIAKAVSVL